MATKTSLKTAGVALLLVPALAACSLSKSGGSSDQSASNHPVGSCARIIQDSSGNSSLETVDCAGAQGTFDASKRIYKVNSIIQGTSGTCPQLAGFFPVQLTDVPDDITYCLVQAD